MIKIFMEHIPMIHERARKYSAMYHQDYDEVRSQAYLLFCEIYKRYNPAKSKFSTFLFISLTFGLNDFCQKEEQNTMNSYEELNDIPVFPSYQKKIEFWDMVQTLSREAQEIISCVFYPDMRTTQPKITKNSLTKEIRKKYSFSYQKIRNTFQEISNFIQQEI